MSTALVLQQYRQRARNAGFSNVDDYDDNQLLRYLGDELRAKGVTMSQMEDSYGGDFTNSYFGLINAPEPGREGVLGGAKEFGAGFRRGASGLMSSAAGIGSIALDKFGYDSASDALMDKAAEFRARAAQGGPSIDRATDVRWNNINDVARFLAGGFGEATPSVIEAAGSFALGGGAGALIAKQAAKKRLNQTLKKINAPQELEDILRGAVTQQAAQQGKQVGANVALAGSSFGMNMGEIYSELHEYSKLNPTDPKYISESEAKRLSIQYGALAGGLDFASAGTMLNRVLNIGEEPARRYLQRLVQNLPTGVFIEGTTEAGQEFLAMAAEKYAHGQDDQLTEDEINRMIDAGVLGALGGAQFSAISAIKGPPTEASDRKIEPGETEGKRPSVATIDERQKNLDKLLKDPTTKEFIPEVGMDVQAGLGVEGKVKEVRGDGIVTIELADGKDVEVGFETLAPKMRTAEELEQAISKNTELAEDGDTSSQIEIMKAQGDLLSAVEIAMGQDVPKDTQSEIEQLDSNTEQKAVFEKGPNKVSGLTQEQASEMDEVYEGLIKIAKEGKLESYEMNQPQKLASALGDDFAKKFIKHKNKLEQSGILNSNKILSAANEPAIGLGLNEKGIPNTKRDIDKISQKKQADVRERTRAIAKRKLGKNVQVKLRNPDLVEKDGTFVEDDRSYEIESIVNPNTGDRGWTDDSNLIKLKGRDELFEPKDLINATPKKSTSKKKKKGEPDEPTEVPPASQQSPKKTVDDLAKSSLTGEDIKVTLEDVRKAFLEKQGGEQGGTVAPQQQELAKQLGFNLDSNGIIEKDNEGNAVTTDVNQEALNNFFAVNSQMLNDPTAQQLALMHREESSNDEADSISGKVFLKHTRSNEQGKLTAFSRPGDFAGRRYNSETMDEGGTFGKDGVYLAEEGNKWNDEDLEWQYAGLDTATYSAEVDFTKGLLITPQNLAEIVKKIHPNYKINRALTSDKTAPTYISEESRTIVVGAEIAAWAKDNGYDGIIVRGFDSYFDSLELQEDARLLEEEKFHEDIGVEDGLGQDQVFYFYPERIKVVTASDVELSYLENQIPEQPTEPVTGFHSTDSDDISKFETNPRKVIGDREVQMGAHFGATPQTVKKGRKRIIEVKVDLKNLLRMPDLNQWNWKNMEEWLLENDVFTDKDVNVYKNIKQSGGFREESIQALLKDKGYDGIVYRNEFEGNGNADSFIVFDSSNIKIVTANKKSQISQQIPLRADGEADILNIIQDTVGKIRTREPDKNVKPSEAMLVIRQALMTGPARLLMGGTKGEPIDTAIMAIKDQVSIDTSGGDAVEILAEMISEAVANRYKLAEESKEVTAFNNYVSALTDNVTRARNQNATRPISAADLVVGDKFKVKGKWVTVTDFDADGFLLEHEDFGETGRFDIGEQKFPIYLSPERGDIFYADQDLIYAEPFANDESDPFGPTAEEYIDNQSRKYKALRGDGIVDPPLGYVAQKVKFPEGEATYFVPERALINLPTGQMPSTLVGSIQMDIEGNIYERAINSDGTFNAARFEGLKKTTGDTKNEKGNRVLLIMQKVSDNDDSLPIRSIRVMQAQQGKAGNDVVIKVYDSLKNIGRLVKRESQESKERSSVMEGYMVIGKVTVDNDLSKYFPGDKTRRGRGGKIDAYFENLQRLEDAPFFKMSREEEQNKKNKNYQTLVTTRKIFNYLAGEGRGIQQAYKDRLAELKVPHDSDGKIEVNGKFIYIQKPEDRDALIASGMDAELAEQVYQANFGNGVTGGLKMQEVHQANLQRDVAVAGNFKFEDKEYSVVQVIMAGQDVNDTSINIGDPIYKKAWSKLGNVGNLSWSGTSEFVDIETGETPLSIGEYSGKYGVDKAFSTSTQLFEIFAHIIDNGGIGSKFLVEDFYTLAEFDVGKYSREDIAVSLGLDKNATDAEIDASLQAFLEESTQALYKLAAIKGLRREGEEGLSSNLIRPLKTYEYAPKSAPIYEGIEEAPVEDDDFGPKMDRVEPSKSDLSELEYRQKQYEAALNALGKQPGTLSEEQKARMHETKLFEKQETYLSDEEIMERFKEQLPAKFLIDEKNGKIVFNYDTFLRPAKTAVKNKIKLGKRLNTKKAVEQAQKKMALKVAENLKEGKTTDRNGYSALSAEERRWFEKKEVVHTSLPPQELAELTERIKALFNDVAIEAGKKDRYIEETGRAPTVGHHRNIIRNRLGIKQLTRREDKTIKQEVATIHQAKGSLVERLRDDFEKDIRDAMQTAGFTEQEIDEFLIASEGMLTKSKLKQPKSIDTEIFLTKDKKERVKADGKTSFKSGFSQSPSGKALRNYVDRIYQNLEQFVSEDNMGKWSKFVDHMNLIWIPEGYSFKSFKKPKPQSKPVLTPQEKEDTELSETFKKSQLQDQIAEAKTLIDTLQSSIDDLLEGKDKNKNAKLRAKEIEAYENLIVDTTRDMEKAQKEMDTMVFTDVTEQVAPPKGEWQIEEVTEAGLLLTEYAQHLREFFVEGQEYSLPYLESKSYTRGETGVDVMEAVGGAERSGTSQLAKAASEQGVEVQTSEVQDLSDLEVEDLEEAAEVDRDAESEMTFEFSREDEILSYDDQDMMDKQVPIKKLLDPVTGEVEEGMPIVVDGPSAAKANRVARKKLARAIRDGKNPLEALGLQEELSNNRLAIREFLASKYNQSTPFPVVSFVERALEIIAENPGFREQEALSHIARKIKGSKMLQGVKIEIMPWEQYSRIASANENGYSAATYIPKKNKIFVSDVFGDLDGTPMENLVSSIIHEAIHVPTKAFLDVGYAYHTGDPIAKKLLTDSFAGEEMGKLYGQINDTLLPMLRKKAGPEHFYALSSIDELLSEVGSDASFRDFLRNQKLTNEDRKALGIEKKGFLKTVWDYIVHVISMLLGRSSNETPELLQYTDRQLNKVIDLADGLSGMGKRIHEVNVRGINKLDIFASKKAASFANAQKGYTTFDWIDGTTRFHITDKTAKINGKPLKESLTSGFSINGEMMLPDLLDHPELFGAYPQLANVKIVEKDIAGAYGMVELKSKNFNGSSQEFYEWHDKNGGDIALITVSPSAPKDIAVPALIHEIQHIVDDIEGVPAGFNTWFAWDLIKGILGTLMGSNSSSSNKDWQYMLFNDGAEKMMNPKVFKQMKSKLDSIVEQTKKLQTEHTLPEHFNYDVFLLYRTMQSVRAMFDKVAEPTSETTLNDWILNTKVGGIDGPTVATFLYNWEFGEVTARTQERFLTEDLMGYPLKTGINNMSELENPPALPFGRGVAEDAKLGRVQSSRKKFADAIEAKKAGEAWSMPSLRSLYGLIQSYSSSGGGDLVNVLTTLASLQSSGSLGKYQKAREGFRPDEGARIGHEAQAAGLNELMDGLTIAYREVQDMLPPETTLQDFIDNYGKLALKWKKNKKATKAMEAIQKLLNPFQVDAKNVRITDAGRNRTAKNYGIRAAIAFNERTREHARQEAAKGVESLELFEKELKAGAKVFDDLARRKMHSNDEMVGWIESKLKNNMTVQRLQKLSDYLPNEILNQEDIKMLNKISKDEILDVMTKAIEIDGFENMKAEEMNDALRNMSTKWFSGGSTQSSLARVALIIAIKDSKDIMFLFRLARNKLGEEQQGFYDAAIEVAKADTIEKIKEIDYKFPGRVSTKFAELINARIRQIELKYKIPEVQNKVKVNQRIDEVLQYRTDKYRYSMGELENFDIRNGVKIKHAFEEDGEWKIGEYKVEFKGGELKNRKEFIKINRKTLEFLRQEKGTYGTEPWWDLMREQAEMALALPVTQQWAAVRRSAWMAGLESVNQRFSRMGYEGKRLAGMTARTVALYRDLISKAQFHSKEYNRAYENVLSALDIDGQEFYTGMYQDIFWWFDNNPQFAGDESQAFKEMWKYIKKQRNVPNKTRLDETSRNAVRTLVEKTIAARDYEAQVNRDLGNRIKDDDFKVQSYLDGDKMVDFYRMPLDMGYATLPRAINDSKVTSLINYMTDEKRGNYAWSGKIDEIPIDAKIRELLELGEVEEMGKEIQKLFDEEITVRFLDEFMGSLNRKSLFYGPKDNDGWGNELGNSYVMQKWDSSKGDLVKFMDTVFNDFNKNAEPSKRGQWYLDFYKQLHERFQELKRVDRQIRSKAESETRETEALKHVPRSLDARQIESRLPKGFFLYDMYDETSTSIRMAMFAGASVFGRDGTKATLAFKEGRKKLKDSYDLFSSVISEVTGMKPDKPEGSYSKSLKLQAYKVLKKRGHKNAKHKFMQLHNDAVAYGELRTTFQHLRKYYGSNNEAGPYKDARFLLELLGTQSLAVLNNPKSSFMQGMSLFEFPLAFRGLNKMALKGTAKALGNFVNQTFGGMAEAMGMQLDKVGRYSANLNNTHYKIAEMELSKRDFITQVGNGAELTDKKNPKRYLRMLKAITQHHKARGTRAPVDMMSLVTGIFPYVNNVVNHSVGVGAIHAYSDLVLKVAEHIEANGLTDKDFREITAEEMGMGGSAFEWIIGEKDGYDNANNMLVEAGAPTITRMAFDFLDRRKVNPDTPVIDYDMGLLINQLAMNNMSGEGFNSKPAWLYTNPMMKYFAFFLGWPLGKVARDNRFIFRGDQDSMNTYAAFLKYIGLMSAIYMPVGLSFAFLIDWYDEEVLNKPNNLPPITPWAALPVIGPLIAMEDPNFSLYGLTSRMAKSGTPYGMGFDVMNSLMAKGDPYSAAREFSLDSRIFAFSMFKNIYDAMGNWMHQGEWDWANVGRPLTYAMGGNSVIQMMDATNAMFDFDNEESRVANYIGVRNYIKSTAYLMGMNLKPPTKGYGRPTPVSVNIRQMERAAFVGDEQGFLKEYREAVEAARKYLADQGRTESPEKYVADRFRNRSLRTGVTVGKINDDDWAALLEILPDDARKKVLMYESNHMYFANEISQAASQRRMSRNEVRARLAIGR